MKFENLVSFFQGMNNRFFKASNSYRTL